MGGAATRLTGNNNGQNLLKVRTELKSQMKLIYEFKKMDLEHLPTLQINCIVDYRLTRLIQTFSSSCSRNNAAVLTWSCG